MLKLTYIRTGMTFFLLLPVFNPTFSQMYSSLGISSVASRSLSALAACDRSAVTALVACGREKDAGRSRARDEVEGTGAGVEVVLALLDLAAFGTLEALEEAAVAEEAVAGGIVGAAVYKR